MTRLDLGVISGNVGIRWKRDGIVGRTAKSDQLRIKRDLFSFKGQFSVPHSHTNFATRAADKKPHLIRRSIFRQFAVCLWSFGGRAETSAWPNLVQDLRIVRVIKEQIPNNDQKTDRKGDHCQNSY